MEISGATKYFLMMMMMIFFSFFFFNYRLKSVCYSYLEIHCSKCECVLGHDESFTT